MSYIRYFIPLVCMLIAVCPEVDAKRTRTRNNSKTTTQTSQPKTSSEAKKKEAEARKEIKLTEEKLKENEAKVSKSLAELGKLDQEIDKTTARINDLNLTLSRIDSEINSLESGISLNEAELAKLREQYLLAVKKMRVTKKNKSTLAFIFSSKSVSQAMRRMRYLREFSDWRNRQSAEIDSKIATLKNQKERLAIARDEQAKALALQKSSQSQLASQHKQQEALVADLKQNSRALQSHLDKKQAEARELGNMVSRLIAEEQRKAAEEEARRKAEEEARQRAAAEEARRKAEEETLLAQSQSASSSETTQTSKPKTQSSPTTYADARKRKPRGQSQTPDTQSQSTSSSETAQNSKLKTQNSSTSTSFPAMQGKLPAPVTGSFAITSRFGRQSLPDLPDVEYDNPGIDAESDPGASARAVFKGKVSGVYLLPGYNTVVIVNHGNYYTVYGNIASPAVKNGDSVEAGKILGKLALNDDDASHSSIHFEVWKNREKLNPQDWLR